MPDFLKNKFVESIAYCFKFLIDHSKNFKKSIGISFKKFVKGVDLCYGQIISLKDQQSINQIIEAMTYQIVKQVD
jgi:hypothetical protein